MNDPTEEVRRGLCDVINAEPAGRKALERLYGKVYSTDEMREVFDVIGFLAPFVLVRRKVDNVQGCLTFQHDPRFYWGFQEDK